MSLSKEQSKDTTRNRIIDTAKDLFAAKGFKGASIRDIEKAVGMHMSNIYHHFGSKEGLMIAILESSAGKTLKCLREVSDSDLDPVDRFKLILKEHTLITIGRKKEVKLVMDNEKHLSPKGYKLIHQTQVEILAIYMKQLGILKKLGKIRSSNITVLAFNILGIINWSIRWFRPNGHLSADEVADQIVDFIFKGM